MNEDNELYRQIERLQCQLIEKDALLNSTKVVNLVYVELYSFVLAFVCMCIFVCVGSHTYNIMLQREWEEEQVRWKREQQLMSSAVYSLGKSIIRKGMDARLTAAGAEYVYIYMYIYTC